MGQKVHPLSFRLGTQPQLKYNPTSPWCSDWFEQKQQGNYSKHIHQDLNLNAFFNKIYQNFGFSLQKILIERKTFYTHIQLALTRTNSSRKILKTLRKLNRNKVAIIQYASLKKRKLQQRQLTFYLKEKYKYESKNLHFLSKINTNKTNFSVEKDFKFQNNWFDNMIQQRNHDIFQFVKKKEVRFELKILPEIRQVV